MPAANAYVQLAEDTARRITHSHTEWTGFLKTAARLYKYPYHEQLMIYAQRPEATACADYRVWNDRMRRYIHRGSKGIALLDVSGDEPKLRYVFDVADTGVRANSRPFSLWQLTEQNENAACRALEDGYDVTGPLEKQMHAAVQQLVMNQWLDHRREILGIVDGSYLEGYDEFNVGVSFRKAVAVSAEYALLSRCGRNPDERFVHEDFLPIFDWNTPEAVTVLGTAVSEMSEEVLRTIEIAVRNHERSQEYEPNYLSAKRGLPASQPDRGENGEAAGPVRPDAENLPEESPAHAVPIPASDWEAVSAPAGDRENSKQPDGAAPAATDETVGRDGAAQGQRHDEVGRADEQLQGPGRRNNSERADLQLNQTVQLSFFPTEEAQIAQIDHAESIQPSAFSFAASVADDEMMQALQAAVSEPDSRMRIAMEYSKGKSIPDLIPLLQKEYRGGTGITTSSGSLSIWCDEQGMLLAHGDSAQKHPFTIRLSWEEMAERIGSLLEQGQYATADELTQMDHQERMELAQDLLYLRQDMTKEAMEMLPTLNQFQDVWPENQQNLAEFLALPEGRKQLQEEMERFSAVYEQNPSLLRFPFHAPAPLLKRLKELEFPRTVYSSDLLETTAPSFITQDEINEVLAQGSNVEGGRERITRYFSEKHTPGEQADFLKEEYGIGGRSHALTGKPGSGMGYDAKGIRLHKTGCPEVALSWKAVAQRINVLLSKQRFSNALLTVQAPSQDEIDNALREWNEDVQSRRELTRFAQHHPAPEELAEWMQRQYGDDLPSFPVTTENGATDLSWRDAAKRVLQLVQENRFFIEEAQTQAAAPPQYHLQGTVYLDQTAFVITEITDRHVQLQDPSLRYPIFRVENRETFEALLRLDSRNQVSGEANQPISNEAAEDAVSSPQRENLPMENFRITDDHLGEGGAKTRYGWNLAAIRTLRQLEAENRPAAPDEQEILFRYVGWGGLPQAFDPQNSDWNKEYEELKGLLSESEYASARASTLNAHYTSPTVIRAMYEAIGRMGFTSGNILEPACGVGNFFGLLPEGMAGSRLYGVELDSLTGRIAKALYPQAHITVAGFETTNRRDFYDLAIGNVPFGNYQVSDKPYDKLHFPIHDYFFAKALDQVRPGGVLAFITSKGTMDKQNPEARRYMAQRAELLGAVRLPNNAFKANAGTEVTSDILFLQKRERPIDIEPDWVHLGITEDGVPVNAYFAEHPEMVLGRMVWADSMYGSRQETACLPIEGAELSRQLAAAMKNITGQIEEIELSDLGEDTTTDTFLPADPDVKNFSYAVVNGEIYYRENSRMIRQEGNAAAKERLKGLVGLRDCVRSLIDQQMENAPDEIIQRSQRELNARYDTFTAQYGLINSRSNANAFAADSSYYLLCSLEILDENHQLSRKADFFSKRTIRPAQAVEHVDTAAEALAVSIAEQAKADMPYMARLSGKTEEELAAELQGVLFPLPDSADGEGHFRYATADEYLSGNIREKLSAAEAAAQADTRFAVNAEALRQAMPKPLEASEIDVRLGATWIDKSYIQSFLQETFQPPFYARNLIKVNYAPATAEWFIDGKSSIPYNDVAAHTTYGTARASAYRILEDTLNLRDVRVYDTVQDAEGKEKRVLNKNETTLAQQKQQAIKEAFRDWIWRDADRRRELTERYNVLFNSTRPRTYSGEHITFTGMNPEIRLRPHQRDAIAHILYGGNTLLAHEVGAGKSATRS